MLPRKADWNFAEWLEELRGMAEVTPEDESLARKAFSTLKSAYDSQVICADAYIRLAAEYLIFHRYDSLV